MRQILFFATPADIAPVLRRFEESCSVKFVAIGTRTTPDREVFLSSQMLPNPGVATHETGSLSQGYLVSLRNTPTKINASVTRKGKKHWNLFEAENEGAVSLGMAGMWKTGTLLPGSLSTVHKDDVAMQLMKSFLAALKAENFIKIDSWWLGADALRMLKSGGRLTKTAEQSPPEFDLKVP